jgi:hypothetical protein
VEKATTAFDFFTCSDESRSGVSKDEGARWVVR